MTTTTRAASQLDRLALRTAEGNYGYFSVLGFANGFGLCLLRIRPSRPISRRWCAANVAATPVLRIIILAIGHNVAFADKETAEAALSADRLDGDACTDRPSICPISTITTRLVGS